MANDKLAPSLIEILATTLRVLTFRATCDEMSNFHWRHLALGLLCTWLAGIGRSWDDDTASLLRMSGIGSVAYVFGLSLLLWLVVMPLCEGHTDYRRVLTFVCLTSPLGVLYAIPVERFMSRADALQMNVAFLTIVAVWRVALLAFYWKRGVALTWVETFTSTLLPLTIIVAPLAVMRSAARIMEAMGGLRDKGDLDPTSAVLDSLGALAIYRVVPLLIWHIALATQKNR